ncbi:MAG: acyltransferase [Cyanobacteria bacterium SBLK]|nr:acyltransferase [Cyanobacteria bacterium SBLK]
MNKRLPIFDWIRSIAILIILFHHLPNYTFNFYDLNNFGIPINLSFLNHLNRYFGLSLFVFVSGYLINIKKRYFTNWNEVKIFIERKLLRIFPLYYLALIFFCWMYNINQILRILIHLFGLQLIFYGKDMIPIRTLWFIGLIVIYYSIFLLFKSSFLRKEIRIAIPVFFWVLFLILPRYFGLTDFRIALYYLVFFLGILCAEKELPNRKSWKYISCISIVCFTSLLIGFLNGYDYLIDEGGRLLVRYAILNIFMFSFSISVYNICWGLAKYLKFCSPICTVIAYASYGMYLFHRPIWYVMQKGLNIYLAIDDRYLLFIFLILVGLPLIFGFSYQLQKIYNKCLQTN